MILLKIKKFQILNHYLNMYKKLNEIYSHFYIIYITTK